MGNEKDRFKWLENQLSGRYPEIDIGNRKCFRINNNEIARIDSIYNGRGVVVEYAESVSEARKNMFEDGDPIDLELKDDEILNRIIDEIEQ